MQPEPGTPEPGTPEPGTPEPGTVVPQRRLVMMFAVVSMALLMSSLDQTIVATALHDLQHGLHASIVWAGWTITAYSLGMVLMLSLAGKLSDRYGRRRVFLASVVVFTTASLCCGLANDIHLLVGLRALQAVGGAGFTPAATGIVVEHFGPARDRAVGLFGSIFPIGAMIGPLLGGLFVTYWSWRGIFLVNVPIGAALIVLCLRFIPADPPRVRGARARLDVSGLTLLGVGLIAAMLGLTFLGDPGTHAVWLCVALLVGAVVFLAAFLRHVRRSSDPLIAPRLIHGRGFGAVNIINVVYGGGVSGMLALVPLYATTRYGISALGSGTLLTAQSIAAIVLSLLAAYLLRRTGYRLPIFLGVLAIVSGVVALAVTPWRLPAYAWLAAAAGLVGAGAGWLSPASRNAGLQLAPRQAASLAALRSTGRQVGSIAAVSIATAVIGQSANPSATQALTYGVFAVLLVLAMPAIARIPEHRGAW